MQKMSNSSCENSLDPVFLQNQLALARREIHNLRQQLTSLNHIHRKECDYIYKKLEKWQCLNCRSRQSDDNTGATAVNENAIDFQSRYIGTISTHFPEKRGTPRQPGICLDLIAKLTLNNNVFTNPSHALEGLQEFSHMWILFHFHKNDSTHVRSKVAPPRLNGIRTGVFATRSPHRPSPIGLSLVKIDRIMENTIYFSGVDMIDQTPVLDIKPYIPQYDNPGLTNLYYPEETLFNDHDSLSAGMTNSVRESGDRALHLDVRDSGSSSDVLQEIRGDLDNLNIRQLDGEENGQRDYTLGAAAIEENHSRSEETFYTRSASRIGEREAPDGEEEESSRSQASGNAPASTPNTQIMVPSWIDQAPVSRLVVTFKDRALAQLSQLGPEGEDKKNTITNVLREDPRSVYLRERWGSHCYVFRIAELYVSCKFNDNTHSVTVYQVFQNEVPEGDD